MQKFFYFCLAFFHLFAIITFKDQAGWTPINWRTKMINLNKSLSMRVVWKDGASYSVKDLSVWHAKEIRAKLLRLPHIMRVDVRGARGRFIRA
jgi:hypothetical protein